MEKNNTFKLNKISLIIIRADSWSCTLIMRAHVAGVWQVSLWLRCCHVQASRTSQSFQTTHWLCQHFGSRRASQLNTAAFTSHVLTADGDVSILTAALFPSVEHKWRLCSQQHCKPPEQQEVKGQDGVGRAATCVALLAGKKILWLCHKT